MTASTPTTESCATCRFWKRDSAGGAIRGYCRIYPPVQHWHCVDSYAVWAQPRTEETEWCGEYREVKKSVAFFRAAKVAA